MALINPLDPALMEKENQSNLNDIESIKRALRKHGNISMKSLTNALLYDQKRYDGPCLYPREYLMMHNPFVKKKKKTRKLKKKSKK